MNTRPNNLIKFENRKIYIEKGTRHDYSSFDHSCLEKLNLSQVSLNFCSFNGTNLSHATLENANLLFAIFDHQTNFHHLNVKNTLLLFAEIDGKALTRKMLAEKGTKNSEDAITNLEELNALAYYKKLPNEAVADFNFFISRFLQFFRNIKNNIHMPYFSSDLVEMLKPYASKKNITILENALKILLLPVKPPVKSLQEQASNYLIANKGLFLTQLKRLPIDITDKYPQLDTDHKKVFVNKVRQAINAVSFDIENEKEKSFLVKVEVALKSSEPRNGMEAVLEDLDKFIANLNTVYRLSHVLFTHKLKALKEQIIELLEEYSQLVKKDNHPVNNNNNNNNNATSNHL